MPTDKKILKRNVKDSVFTNLFQDTKYIVELYKALHPEADYVTEDMIEIVTLKNILTDSLYNDLGFMMDKSKSQRQDEKGYRRNDKNMQRQKYPERIPVQTRKRGA